MSNKMVFLKFVGYKPPMIFPGDLQAAVTWEEKHLYYYDEDGRYCYIERDSEDIQTYDTLPDDYRLCPRCKGRCESRSGDLCQLCDGCGVEWLYDKF